MKTCSTCGVEKPLDDFHKSAHHASGRQPACKACRCAHQKARYEANKPAHRATIAARQQSLSDFIDTFKLAPCLDCGESYPPYVMDFDHRPGEVKLFAISKMRNQGQSKEKIVAEIAKCDLVCSNCHRERTFQRYSNRVDGLMKGSV